MKEYICIFGEKGYTYSLKVVAENIAKAENIAIAIMELELQLKLPLKHIYLSEKNDVHL